MRRAVGVLLAFVVMAAMMVVPGSVAPSVAAFLHRLADYEKAKPTLGKAVSFKDVSKSTPHAADIAWLARTGVTTGRRDGTSRGMNEKVRQDMAAFLHRMSANVLK